MKTKKIICIILLMIISFMNINAQNPSSVKKHKTTIKSIWDIPHVTNWQKRMWINRSYVFEMTKERPVNYDTSYIKSYYKRLVIILPFSTRFLNFSLIDLLSKNKLSFAPNLQYNIGIGVSSKWASFSINNVVKIFNNNTDIKGKTSNQNYQLNLYFRKFITEILDQNYSGYYIKNSESFNSYKSDKRYLIRADVKTLNFEVNTYYIVNNRSFSYGNSFAFVEQQKKSAGSLLLGLYYSYFDAKGSPSLVTSAFKSSFDTLSLIHNGHTYNIGVNLGYIYTLVFLKRFYSTASYVQGFGGEQVNYQRDDNSTYNKWVNGAEKSEVRLAFGYDDGKYFAGAMGMYDYFFYRGNVNPTFDYSYGKFMVYIGYRFAILKKERKLLHNLKLIDY